MVYGFALNDSEFLKLILAQCKKTPDFAGEMFMVGPSENPEDVAPMWRLEGMCSMRGKNDLVLHDLNQDFILNVDSAQVKARALFPELPEGVKLFYHDTLYGHTWHLGIQTFKYSSEWFADGFDDTIERIPLESCEERLRLLFQRYGSYFKEQDQKPVLFEVTPINPRH